MMMKLVNNNGWKGDSLLFLFAILMFGVFRDRLQAAVVATVPLGSATPGTIDVAALEVRAIVYMLHAYILYCSDELLYCSVTQQEHAVKPHVAKAPDP